MTTPTPAVLWEPHDTTGTEIARYVAWLRTGGHLDGPVDYARLWKWSVADPDRFWSTIWEFFDIKADGDPHPALAGTSMPGARWFPNVALNYAEHALTHDRPDMAPAVIAHNQTDPEPTEITYGQLRERVARARAGLLDLGVRRGDRVAAYLPNIPETVVAFLAAASIGAVWSSCPPEFGTTAVIDRFGQIAPTVLLVVDGYTFGDRTIDLRAEHAALRAGLASVTTTVLVSSVFEETTPVDMLSWGELLGHPGELSFDRVPFDHPLYVLYSSGTTGLPKPIVHGHGGMLLTTSKTAPCTWTSKPTIDCSGTPPPGG
ncbi:AMP-binding protein [Nocardia abscessus]|uniref:AMP-binding protein n=1 Tax=Nocardia abscessus TaxID=120957 RepID=UPI00226BCD07|nr:AMP-binding protein [Nocardia abscessus]